MKNLLLTRPEFFAIIFVLVVFSVLFSACQADDSDASIALQNDQTGESTTELSTETEINPQGDTVDQTDQPTQDPSDPEVITAQWTASAHATSFVTDPDGKNNSCAQCHGTDGTLIGSASGNNGAGPSYSFSCPITR